MKGSCYYISPNFDKKEDLFVDAVRIFEAGCKIYQLRMKGLNSEAMMERAKQIRRLTTNYGVTFIINDHADLALDVEADGVHVGRKDQAVKSIRSKVPKHFIVGSTANTFEDIEKVRHEADYIGLGPFRYTTTKEKLSPILGLAGMRNLLEQCIMNGISLPIYAIGGITDEDIEDLAQMPLKGVALSSFLHQHPNSKTIIDKVERCFGSVDQVVNSSN
ncbi:MAG: thiamine phosphate synthase [Cyclobacteriaceae bacterium]|nr:thiamine phosphate synthase [Cyclobacteriaceae bacterium]MCH8517025.1 thiamine phosphate synthase [Cyclobacteriaceae bacterium]